MAEVQKGGSLSLFFHLFLSLDDQFIDIPLTPVAPTSTDINKDAEKLDTKSNTTHTSLVYSKATDDEPASIIS